MIHLWQEARKRKQRLNSRQDDRGHDVYEMLTTIEWKKWRRQPESGATLRIQAYHCAPRESHMTWSYQQGKNAAAPGQPLRQSWRSRILSGRGAAWQHPAFGSRWSHVRIVPSRPIYERSSTAEQWSPKPPSGGSNPSARATAAYAAPTLTSEETISLAGGAAFAHSMPPAPPLILDSSIGREPHY
jgi:hypothetical protein